MTDLFDKLYSQFLRGKTNRKDFEGFKESLNHLSDQELAERMEAFWDENTVYPSMEVGRKREIHRRLRLQIHPPKISIRWSRIVAAAAVIAVLSVTAWNFSLLHELQNANSSFLAEVPAGDKVQLTLPDKSSVKLNSESSLSYAYVNGKRVARLKGEGYFQVSKDRKHPFVVQVGNLNIEVLGTCFNVYSYEENDFVETSLIEGSVRLYDSKSPSESFILKPSQRNIQSNFKGLLMTFYGSTSIKTGNPELNSLVATRGMSGMMNTIWLILCAMCFGGAMAASGMLGSITSVFLRFMKRTVGLVTSTVASGLFLNICTADQYISIILTGNMFKDIYEKKGYESRLLSRTVEDSVTVTSVLIPWNTCGMTQATILGVATFIYLPYCFFNLISPLMSITIAAIGFKIKRKNEKAKSVVAG